MKLSSVILRTTNVDRSKRFWSQTVGLKVAFDSPAFVFLDGDGTQLILSAIDSEAKDESLTEIVFQSEDVRNDYESMSERGVPFELELRTITTNEQQELLGAHFRDPDGHYGSLTGWVDAK